jgi:hypothetical protein
VPGVPIPLAAGANVLPAICADARVGHTFSARNAMTKTIDQLTLMQLRGGFRRLVPQLKKFAHDARTSKGFEFLLKSRGDTVDF